MKLIVIEGPAATGKSHLARRLAKDLKIEAILKDDYKEKEFDKLQKLKYKDMRRIENESWNVIYSGIKRSADNNKSLIVEANFFPTKRRKIKKSLNKNVVVKEIYCHANGFTNFRRYLKRNRSGERHPAHKDQLWYVSIFVEAFILWLEYFYRPLYLSRKVLRVNTTDFSKINYDSILSYINQS